MALEDRRTSTYTHYTPHYACLLPFTCFRATARTRRTFLVERGRDIPHRTRTFRVWRTPPQAVNYSSFYLTFVFHLTIERDMGLSSA